MSSSLSIINSELDRQISAVTLTAVEGISYRLLRENKDRYSEEEYFDMFCESIFGVEDRPMPVEIYKLWPWLSEELARKLNPLRKYKRN